MTDLELQTALKAFARRLKSSANRFSTLLIGGSLTVCDDPEGVADPDDVKGRHTAKTDRQQR
jgi:hypothetical protein